MNQSKIERILDEQKTLLDNISDGAMIYRITQDKKPVDDLEENDPTPVDIEIKYTNNMLIEMFK